MAPSEDTGCQNCGKGASAHSGQGPEMLLNILHCTRQFPAAKNDLVLNINNVKSEKHWLNN